MDERRSGGTDQHALGAPSFAPRSLPVLGGVVSMFVGGLMGVFMDFLGRDIVSGATAIFLA